MPRRSDIRRVDRTVIWLGDLADRFRQSLFFLPALFVVVGGTLPLLLAPLSTSAVPEFLATSVENGRAVFTTVATGTMAAVSIVFAVMLVALQLSASRFSPRVVREFVGDRLIQVVMGIEIGTVTYSLVGLQTIGTSDSSDVAGVTVTGAILLAVVALLSLLAAVDHLARSLQVGSIARRVTHETLALVKGAGGAPRNLRFHAPTMVPAAGQESGTGVPVLAWSEGWVQQIGAQALEDVLPEGVELTLDVAIGSYVAEGSPIAWVDGSPAPDIVDQVRRDLRQAVDIGTERTMQQDVGYGIVRLEDIALLALSPAINDLNTGIEAIVRLGSVLMAMVGSEPEPNPPRHIRPAKIPTFDDFVAAAFDEIRISAASHPTVLEALLRTLGRVRDEAIRRGDPDAVPPLVRQGQLVVAGLESRAIYLEADRARVRAAARACLGDGVVDRTSGMA